MLLAVAVITLARDIFLSLKPAVNDAKLGVALGSVKFAYYKQRLVSIVSDQQKRRASTHAGPGSGIVTEQAPGFPIRQAEKSRASATARPAMEPYRKLNMVVSVRDSPLRFRRPA